MNFKKTVVSLFAVTAIASSLTAPVVLADDADETTGRTTNAQTTEIGTRRTGHLWNNFSFGNFDVSNTQGGNYIVNTNTLEIRDNRADSTGWTVQISATDLHGTSNPEAFIEADQLTITRNGNAGFQDKCYTRDMPSAPPVNPSNDYYTAEYMLDAGVNEPLGSNVTVMQADPKPGATRGCGIQKVVPRFELTVLPGQQIDTYTGTVTVTTIWGEPDGE